MKNRDRDWKRAFGQADAAFEENIHNTLRALQAREEEKFMKKKLTVTTAVALAAALILAAAAFAASTSGGLLDLLTGSLADRPQVLPQATAIVESDIEQAGGDTGDAVFRMREAIYDGEHIYMTGAVQPRDDKTLLLGDDSEPGDAPQYRYIGIDEKIAALPQVRFIDGDCMIDDELSLFVIKERAGRLPFSNARLKRETGGVFRQDAFDHEHFLVIKEGARRVLVSGCAHNGVLNILKEYTRRFGAAPDAVISGFHLMKKTDYTAEEIREIEDTAKELKQYPTVFYTCHCTGLPAFERMKQIMGSQLEYVHSGDEIAPDFG